MYDAHLATIDPALLFANTPYSRPYTHIACGGATVITDDHFARLCNPFDDVVERTTCATCGQSDKIDQFKWADTLENIADYRARIRALIPPDAVPKRALRNLLIIGISTAVGALIGIAINPIFDDPEHRPIGQMLGAMIAFFGSAGVVLVLVRKERLDFRRFK